MRQLLIGADVTSATATGLVAYKKVAATGATALLVTGDTLQTAPEVKFCRNGSGECSPWIQGKDITNWGGISGAAQTAESVAILTSVAPTTAGTIMMIKLIDQASGSEPYVRENIEFVCTTATATTSVALGAAVAAHIAAPGYNGMIASTSQTGSTVTIVGHTYAGPSAIGYNAQTNIAGAFDANGDATGAHTFTSTAATSTLGDSFILADFEKSLLGSNKGDYYRVQQPDATVTYAVAGLLMDVYTLGWNSRYSNGQINKVDNNHELYMAVPGTISTWVRSGSGVTAFETIMNGYLAHTSAGNLPVVAL
jgi:hypothetical protein